MAKFRGSAILILCVLVIMIFPLFAVGDEGQHGTGNQEKRRSVSEMLRSMFSRPSTTPPASTSYWEKFKTTINQAHNYFFPPNLDFRGSDGGEVKDGGGGAGYKVKEAVAKSLEKGKATVDDSAKSAGKMAAETVQKTVEKVKKSFSDKGGKAEDEL